jgi:prevent-host-death family protein
MQKSVGVRELRAKTSRVLKRVREKRETVDVTYRGQVIARIVPVISPAESADLSRAVWAEIDLLAGEIGRRWPAGQTAAAAVSEGRRG